MRQRSIYSVAIGLLVFAGCASGSSQWPTAGYPVQPVAEGSATSDAREQPADAGAQSSEPIARKGSSAYAVPCPTEVPGTSVVATPLQDGAGLTFVAPEPNVDELRRRVRALASTQNVGARLPSSAADPRTALPTDEPREPTASVQDVEGGARLDFKPSRLDQVTEVQSNVYDYAQRLAGGTCPLMRDELSLLPAKTPPRVTTTNIPPVPAGIIPGVGGLPSATTIPGIGTF